MAPANVTVVASVETVVFGFVDQETAVSVRVDPAVEASTVAIEP